MQRIKSVFKTCYELLERYSDGIADSDWADIAKYYEGRLDPADLLAVAMFTVCYEELARQYQAGRDKA